MKLPYLQSTQQSVDMVSQFGGLNKKLLAPENEFTDMTNMSALQFPMAATREKRGHIKINGYDAVENAIGIHAKDRLLISYTQKGSSGVTFTNGLDAADITGTKQQDGIWTTELAFNDSSDFVTHTILTSDPGGNSFLKKNSDKAELNNIYFYQNGNHIAFDFYGYDVKNETILIKWPHAALSDATEWGLFIGKAEKIEYISAENKTRVTFIDKGYFPVGFYKTKFNGTDAKIRVKNYTGAFETEIGENTFDDYSFERTFKLDGNITDIARGDNVYVYIGIPFGIKGAEAKNENSLYSFARIHAQNEEAINRARGNTLACNGNKFNIVSISKESEDYIYTAKIERPHGSIPAGYSMEEDRFFLGEINPETGDMVSTNICPAVSGKRHIVEMGAYLIVFPEKIMINTAERSLSGHYNSVENLEFSNYLVHEDSEYRYRLVLYDGTVVDPEDKGVLSAVSPQEPFDGQLWIDNSTTPYTFKKWSEQACLWATFEPYCELWGKAVSDKWEVGDAFEFDTIPTYINPKEGQKYFVISAAGKRENEEEGNFIRFPCSMKTAREAGSSSNSKRVLRRTVPDLDFVVESENRLWGCKYGEVEGEMVNEIFACKLGDPKNWHYFANVSIDSYYANLGAEGAFTGAITYNSNPFFFREDCFHRVYGNYPANFAVKTYKAHGVEEGSEHSLVVMNDVLYYKSPAGVMAYTGATPVNISEALGQEKLREVCSGTVNNNMYLTMKDSEGVPSLYVYNDYYRLWHREDDLEVKSFATWDNELYALSKDNKVYCLSGGYGDKEDALKWSFTSGTIGFLTPFHKSIFKINARLSMGYGARAEVLIQYDSSGNWEHIANIQPSGRVGSVSIPIMPRRCDHFSLRFSGVGDVKLLSLVKYMEEGSDV